MLRRSFRPISFFNRFWKLTAKLFFRLFSLRIRIIKMSSFRLPLVNRDLYQPSSQTMETLLTKEVTSTSTSSSEFKHPTAFTAHSKKEYGLDYFLRGALAGGICCGVTHGALTPVDVVKTRMQLDPSKYSGMISGASKIAAEEGAGALLTGLAPTCFGYFVQGWFKFGGVEYFKIKAVETLGEQKRGITRRTFIWARRLERSLSRMCFCARWKRREFD